MADTKSKRKALKNTADKNGFFRALIFGFISCVTVWIVIALLVAFLLFRQSASSGLLTFFSPAIPFISLFAGGFVVGKTTRQSAVISAFLLGCAVLGLCYAVSTCLDLSENLSPLMKTVLIALMLIGPVVGAKTASRQQKNKGFVKRNVKKM